MQATFLLFHPVCVCVWTDLTDRWRKHDWHKLWLSDSFPSHSHVISVGARLFPLTSSLSPTIPFLHYLSASDVSPPSLLLLQYLWHRALSARGGRFFMWKRARSSWGGIHSQVLGSSCREVSLLQKPYPLPRSSALLSPTAQLRGNAMRRLTSKHTSCRQSPWTRVPYC